MIKNVEVNKLLNGKSLATNSRLKSIYCQRGCGETDVFKEVAYSYNHKIKICLKCYKNKQDDL